MEELVLKAEEVVLMGEEEDGDLQVLGVKCLCYYHLVQ